LSYTAALRSVLALALLMAACSRTPEDKVQRWASEIPPAPATAPKAVDPLTLPIPEPVDLNPPPVAEPQAAPAASEPLEPCERVVQRACSTLGIHSDECHEMRHLVPAPPPANVRSACATVVDEQARLLDPKGLGDGQSPCLLMVRRVCQRHGYKTAICDETKEGSRLLTSARRREACIGQLLLLELRRALNPSGNE
jgi:hypothetical protein